MKDFFSKIKNMRYRIKNRRRLSEEAQARVYGFSVASETLTFSNDKLILRALLNALIMFAVAFGLNLSFVVPFEIDVNIAFIGIFCFIISCFFSFINIKKGVQSLGYILFFIAFTAFLIMFRAFINSGLNGMLNDFYDFISDKLDFSRIRTYDEAYPDIHTSTVTVFFIIITSALCLLINFTFNNEQSPLTVFVIAFPFLQLAMYVDEFSGMPSFFFIVLSLTIMIVLRYNFQHRLPLKKNNKFYLKRKNEIYQLQNSSGKVTMQALAFVAAILLVFSMIISVLIPEEKFRPSKDELALKESTKSSVTQVLMYGLGSLFMRDKTTWDSQSGGTLGNAGTVYQDFEDDLAVTFTPYQYSTVYLRGNAYSEYLSTNWAPTEYDTRDNLTNASNMKTQLRLYMDSASDKTILQGKMQIEALDYSLFSADFYPYYGIYSDPVQITSNRIKNIDYVAVQDFWNSKYTSQIKLSDGTDEYSNYLNLYGNGIYTNPDDEEHYEALKNTLDEICLEEGFSGTPAEIISQVQAYLEDGFTYTLNPGLYPKGEDFVSYFLTKSKKGYCAYFATAGALLLRNMGIPARYVEGYALDMSAVIGGDTLDEENYDEWINGESLVGKTAVVKAYLTDANAHAWVEVYVDELGWVPVEFTNAGTMDESDKDAWGIWSSIISSGNDLGENAGGVLAGLLGADYASIFKWIGKLLLVLIALAVPFVGYKIYRYIQSTKAPETISYARNNRELMKSYQKLVNKLTKSKIINDANPVPTTVKDALINNGIATAEKAERLRVLYCKAAFSKSEITDEELKEFKELIK